MALGQKNSNNMQFPLIFFTLVAHTEIKLVYRFIIGISRPSSVLGPIEPFWQTWPLDVDNILIICSYCSFFFFFCRYWIYWNEISYTDLLENKVKVSLEYDPAIFNRIMPLGLREILLLCSLRSFSSHWLHILIWNLVYRFIIRISTTSFFWVRSSHFWQTYAPLTLKNSS
jgi:hypothetical protein